MRSIINNPNEEAESGLITDKLMNPPANFTGNEVRILSRYLNKLINAGEFNLVKNIIEANLINFDQGFESTLKSLTRYSDIETARDIVKRTSLIFTYTSDDIQEHYTEKRAQFLYGKEIKLEKLETTPLIFNITEDQDKYDYAYNQAMAFLELEGIEEEVKDKAKIIADYIDSSSENISESKNKLLELQERFICFDRLASLLSSEVDFKPIKFESPFTFGVENESFGVLNLFAGKPERKMLATEEGWEKTLDQTIEPHLPTSGKEVISRIVGNHQGDRDFRRVTEMLYLQGMEVNESCAFHTHVGIKELSDGGIISEELGLEIIKQAILNYIELEDDMGFIDPNSRLTFSYKSTFKDFDKTTDEIKPLILESKSVEALKNLIQPGGKKDKDGYTGRRRARINLFAVDKHGTIEFRHHPGTVEPNEQRAWLKFIDKFMLKSYDMVIEAGRKAHAPKGMDADELKYTLEKYVDERKSTSDFKLDHTSVIGDVEIAASERVFDGRGLS